METVNMQFFGTYLQIKAMMLLIDFYENKQPLMVTLDLENTLISCNGCTSEDVENLTEMWETVKNTMNEWVEGVVAMQYGNKHNWFNS